jgi:hypothetical protein
MLIQRQTDKNTMDTNAMSLVRIYYEFQFYQQKHC